MAVKAICCGILQRPGKKIRRGREMAKREFAHPNEMHKYVGQEIGVSDWIEVSQARINQFAEATGDHQWIHVDPERAAAESPFKSTIAHGFLTLSLLSTLIRESIQFTGLRMAINCGLNRVRFVSPVPAGSRIRALITPQLVSRVTDGGIQVTWQVTIE